MDIMPNLSKLKFKEFDTWMQHRLERVYYMVSSQPDPTEAQVPRPMEWVEGFIHAGLMNLLFMPHFGHILQVNNYVKQQLVFFHSGFLWLDRPYMFDVELISVITSLQKKGDEPAPYFSKKDTSRIKQK